ARPGRADAVRVSPPRRTGREVAARLAARAVARPDARRVPWPAQLHPRQPADAHALRHRLDTRAAPAGRGRAGEGESALALRVRGDDGAFRRVPRPPEREARLADDCLRAGAGRVGAATGGRALSG